MNAAQQCQAAMEGVGAGIGASLRGVDCAASAMAQAAFTNIFTSEGQFGSVLTATLTLFVALFGFLLMTGRLRISLSSLTPRMVTLVLVITFATSWVAFQAVFWNLAVGTPDFIATQLMGTNGSATTIFADKLDLVMISLMEASGGDAMENDTSIFSPPGLLWSGGTMLLLGTVGVLATCKIALAILMGLGPFFILMALFDGTRGLFVGWLKGVVLLALAPLFAVFGGSLMLELAIPVLSSLAQTPGRIDVRPAMAFFMIGAVHLALMFMILRVTTTMVSGWNVFGLVRSDRGDDRSPAPVSAPVAMPAANPAMAGSQGQAGTAAGIPSPSRDIRIAAAMPIPANDTASGSATTTRETRIVGAPVAGQGANGGQSGITNRARGIGSRFRAPAPRTSEKK